MATSKSKQADATVAVKAANQKGLEGFDGRKVVAAVTAAHDAASKATEYADAKAAAAFAVCCEAQRLREAAPNLDPEAFASGWRYSFRGIYAELFAAGVTWIEAVDKDGKDRTYKLTGYGRNVSSDASRTGQYSIDAVECGSLQAVRKAITAAQEAEALEAESDVERETREAREAYLELRKQLESLLSDAESAEAYDMASAVMAELITANTPIEVPEAEAKAA